MKKLLLFLLLHFLLNPYGQATHIRSGEIRYTQIDAKTIEASILIYAKASSANADRDSLTLCWGDGACERIARVNGPVGTSGVPNGEILDHDFKKNVYTATHQYANLGNYILSMTDPSRNAGILNIVLADNFAFHIETEVFLSEALNHSPFNLQAPIDIAVVNEPFMHLLNAVDLDGDSIAFEMLRPLAGNAQPVTGYFDLTDISPGPNNTLDFNTETGLLIWDAPQDAGEYNIAIQISSFRNGQINGRVIRDMLILVFDQENQVPVLTSPTISYNEAVVDVTVGDTVRIQIDGEDMDIGQQINLSSTSELYSSTSDPALFDVTYANEQMGTAVFTWVVKNEEVRKEPYQVAFKVQDNFGAAAYLEVRYSVKQLVATEDQQKENDKLHVFPNPAKEFLFVEGLSAESTPYSIWNNLGQVMQSGVVSKHQKIDLHNIPSGFYYLQLKNRAGQVLVIE